MTFEELQKHLRHRLRQGLPGEEVQYAMAPLGRREQAQEYLKNRPRKAGVLVLLYPDAEPCFVLTQRHSYKGVHSDQVSLPGGSWEPGDIDLTATAIREAREEVNIDPSRLEVLGHLTELYIPPSNYLIYPVVAVTAQKPEFVPEEAEVKEILEVPLSTLLHADAVKSAPMRLSAGKFVDVPYFDLLGRKVWGATAMVLSELKVLASQ